MSSVATMYLSDIPACLTGTNNRHMPILSCSQRGLPRTTIAASTRALLPPVFTLTVTISSNGGYFLWHLSIGFRLPSLALAGLIRLWIR